MGKGEIKVRKKRGTQEIITHDPRVSSDRKTLVVVQETTSPTDYREHLLLLIGWANQELDAIGAPAVGANH